MDHGRLTPVQLALALVIAKSKPASVSIEEFIMSVRECATHSPKILSSPMRQSYIDAVQFWKRAYEKSETENAELRNRILELQSQSIVTEDSNRRGASPSLSTQITNISAKKKKNAAQQINKANMQSKRKKLNNGGAGEISSDIELESELRSGVPGSQTLLRSVFGLQALMRDRKATAKNISQVVAIVSRAAGKCVKDACQEESTGAGSAGNTVSEDIFKVVSKMIFVLRDGLKQVAARLSESDEVRCTYDIVLLFQTLLGQLHQFSLDEADRSLIAEQHQTRKQTHAHTKAETDAAAPSKFHRHCAAVTKAMETMFSAFANGSHLHQTVLEGMTCLLLEHIGSSLGLLVFADADDDIGRDKGVRPPQGLLDTDHIETDIALGTVELAAPHLLTLLHKALAAGAMSKCGGSNRSHKSSIAGKLFERLQNTLLRGLFGDEDRFLDSLQRPEEQSEERLEDFSNKIAQDADRRKWFIGQVWEHLGWDVLTSDI